MFVTYCQSVLYNGISSLYRIISVMAKILVNHIVRFIHLAVPHSIQDYLFSAPTLSNYVSTFVLLATRTQIYYLGVLWFGKQWIQICSVFNLVFVSLRRIHQLRMVICPDWNTLYPLTSLNTDDCSCCA